MADEQKQLLEHLSSEINTHSINVMTFRSKLSFVVLIGPFIVLGSFLVAIKGEIDISKFDVITIMCLLLSASFYLAIGYFASRLDCLVTLQIMKWREQILSIVEGEMVDKKDLLFRHSKRETIILYMCFFISSLGAFTGIAIASFRLIS